MGSRFNGSGVATGVPGDTLTRSVGSVRAVGVDERIARLGSQIVNDSSPSGVTDALSLKVEALRRLSPVKVRSLGLIVDEMLR